MAEPITDEDALISAARAGNTDAFLQLQRIHLPAVWDFAIRCTLDDEAATDVVREVFLRASRRMGELGANAQLPVLLYGLAVRQLAFREPAYGSAVIDPSRFAAWPVGAPEGYVDPQDAGAVWAAMRSYGSEYKGLDLYVRRGLRSTDIAGALEANLTDEASVSQEILWSLATVDAALGPIGDSALTATEVFAGLKMVEAPHHVAAALWQELRSSFAPPARGPRVLAVMGVAAIGVLATAGSLKAFTGEEPTSVLGAQELRAIVRATTTTTVVDASTTLPPGPPVRVTTTAAGEVQSTTTAVPGRPVVTTTTRRTVIGPFVAPTVPTTTAPPVGDGGPTSSSTSVPRTSVPGTSVPGTSVPSTAPTTTRAGSTSTTSTTRPPTTTTRPSTTTAPPTTAPPTTAPPTTAPPTTAPPTTAPPTTAPPTTAPPTTAPPTTAPPTTVPPPTTTEPPPTTTEPPPTTTEPPIPVIP